MTDGHYSTDQLNALFEEACALIDPHVLMGGGNQETAREAAAISQLSSLVAADRSEEAR